MEEAIRCLQCAKPTCMQGCPVNIDIPRFLALIADGDFQRPSTSSKRPMRCRPLPDVSARRRSQCEGVCVLNEEIPAVAVGRLERFVADWEAKKGRSRRSACTPERKKVAVVGAGPAGLTAAADLARMGHQVTIFEALHESGGVLVYGIPEFRLPKAIVKREVDYV